MTIQTTKRQENYLSITKISPINSISLSFYFLRNLVRSQIKHKILIKINSSRPVIRCFFINFVTIIISLQIHIIEFRAESLLLEKNYLFWLSDLKQQYNTLLLLILISFWYYKFLFFYGMEINKVYKDISVKWQVQNVIFLELLWTTLKKI